MEQLLDYNVSTQFSWACGSLPSNTAPLKPSFTDLNPNLEGFVVKHLGRNNVEAKEARSALQDFFKRAVRRSAAKSSS